LAGPTGLAGASLCILSVNVLLGVLLILVDEIGSCRNHDLGLLRLSAAKSRDRIAKLGIRSKQVDRFVNALWSNPELRFTFKKTRLESVELMVQALDLLSRIASRYGRCGRRVFEANQYPMVRAMQLFECMPFADAEKMLVEPLKTGRSSFWKAPIFWSQAAELPTLRVLVWSWPELKQPTVVT
jgi:hypothetical protein